MYKRQALACVRTVQIEPDAPTVLNLVAERIATMGGAVIETSHINLEQQSPGVFQIPTPRTGPPTEHRQEIFIRVNEKGGGVLAATALPLLFGSATNLLTRLGDDSIESYEQGRRMPVAFSWQRSLFDFTLTQEGRIQFQRDPSSYVERLASRGFTHIEVNGLASAHGYETGPPDEIYPMFYTYGPALDQFVASKLNTGLYPKEWLCLLYTSPSPRD